MSGLEISGVDEDGHVFFVAVPTTGNIADIYKEGLLGYAEKRGLSLQAAAADLIRDAESHNDRAGVLGTRAALAVLSQ